jgi:hypothetical protein
VDKMGGGFFARATARNFVLWNGLFVHISNDRPSCSNLSSFMILVSGFNARIVMMVLKFGSSITRLQDVHSVLRTNYLILTILFSALLETHVHDVQPCTDETFGNPSLATVPPAPVPR